MTLSTPYEDNATIGATEYSLPNDSTTLTPISTDGIYQVFLDLSAMATGDRYAIRFYEKAREGGAQYLFAEIMVDGAQSQMWTFPPFIGMIGWDVTVQKIAGTDRSIKWSIRQVSGTMSLAHDNQGTVGTTEYSLSNNSTTIASQTTDGIYQLFLTAVNTIPGDTFRLRILEKIATGDTQRVVWEAVLDGRHSAGINGIVSPTLILTNGWDFTAQRLAGSDRVLAWTIRKVG